jgi:hypothetical protein
MKKIFQKVLYITSLITLPVIVGSFISNIIVRVSNQSSQQVSLTGDLFEKVSADAAAVDGCGDGGCCGGSGGCCGSGF